MTKKMTGYKGTDNNLQCRGYQYEIGKEHTHEGNVDLCEEGFHFCENPFDVFGYYAPGESRYFTVEADGVSDETDEDSKRVSSSIMLVEEIGIGGMVDRGVKHIKSQIKDEAKEGEAQSAATNTGNWSAATNTGNRSAATNTGDQSAATNTGNWSAAANTGYRSAAANTGDQSAATNTGNWSAAANTGNWSAAANTGYRSAATNTGDQSAATNTGYRSAATNTGDQSAATNTGYRSAATNTGYRSAATNTGDQSAATNTGDQSTATNTGDWSAAEVSGKESVAIALGIEGKAKGAKGCWITLAEWEEIDCEWRRTRVKTRKVDGKHIKADTFYTMKNGKFVEVEAVQ